MTDTIAIPYSLEAEQALIGSVLLRPELYVTLEVETGDFYQHKHRCIWQVFGELDAIDYVTVCERLKAKKQLDMIGGSSYLTSLLGGQLTTLNADEYAEIVRDYARRRGVIELANEMVKAAFDTRSPIFNKTGEFINNLVDASRSSKAAVHISEVISRLYDDIEERSRNPKEIWGIPTHFPKFDRYTGGLQPTELMILSGEPGVGKSILGMQMGIQMAATAPGTIYSMEMGEMSLARRMISSIAKVSTRAIKTGRIENDDWTKLVTSMDKLGMMNLYLSDSSGWTTTSLRADLARLKAQHQIQWFVLDYLYLLNDGAGSDENERTALASKGLKQICMDLDLAGIAIHSMNKSQMGNDGMPGNQSLRGSGQVIYDADLIIYLTKFTPRDLRDDLLDKEQHENMRTLWFGKGRELEDHKKYLHLVKQIGYPLFGELEDK